MSRVAALVASVVTGIVVGAVLMISIQGNPAEPGTDLIGSVSTTTRGTRAAPTTAGVLPPTGPASDQVLLVWTPGSLPVGLARDLEALPDVGAVTTVNSGLIHMTASYNASGEPVDILADGYVVPLEVMAFDPQTYPPLLSKKDISTFAQLGAGEMVLGATSARIRGVGTGGVIILEDGAELEVVAVVDDVLIGAAEGAVSAGEGRGLGIDTERYSLVRHSGTRATVEAAIRTVLGDHMAVRIRAPGETPFLRHGDAVLPQVMIKEQFGEFAYRPGQTGSFSIDAEWVLSNIITTRVPIIGDVTCHRNLVPALTGAMAELEKRNLSFLVVPDEFAGCFNPRFIADRPGISRHAWGAAVDINFGSNPQGVESAQDPRLLDIMQRWGFTSGHAWLIPDPGHFEYVQGVQQP